LTWPPYTQQDFKLFTLHSIMVLALMGTYLLYSLSCLQAIENLDIENPLVISILELHSTFKTLPKNVVFYWVPSHVSIRGNEIAGRAAKTALKGRKINIPLPFADFRPIIKQYVRKQWSDFWSLQSEINCMQCILH